MNFIYLSLLIFIYLIHIVTIIHYWVAPKQAIRQRTVREHYNVSYHIALQRINTTWLDPKTYTGSTQDGTGSENHVPLSKKINFSMFWSSLWFCLYEAETFSIEASQFCRILHHSIQLFTF